MDSNGGLNESLVAEVENMLRDGVMEGLVRRLMRDFPTMASEAAAAVGHAVEKLVSLKVPPDRPRPYLATCAYNEMKREFRRRKRHQSLEALAGDGEEPPEWAVEDGRTVEEEALVRATYDLLKAHVQTWTTENVRVVTLLYLEAAFECEPLPSETAAQIAGELLGYEVDASFVRTWKSRGFKRLREYVATIDVVDV